MSVDVADRLCANCSCKEGDHRAMFHPVTGLEADRRCDKCPCRWFAMAETPMGLCDCKNKDDAHRCVSLNGEGEECGHDISIHSSVAADQRCLMTGCGCSFFTMLGLLHPSRHQANCARFVPVVTPQMAHKNEFMKILAKRHSAQDALRGINTPRESAPPQVVTASASCRACEVETELGTEECPHPVDERLHSCVEYVAKKRSSPQADSWLCGYAAALAAVQRLYGETTLVKEVMKCDGLTVAHLRAAGVESFDLIQIVKAVK